MGGQAPMPEFRPPAKIDRSAQRTSWTETQNNARQSQADGYNTRVDQFNTGLQNYLNEAASLRSNAQNLTILDDERFGDISNQVSSSRARLSGFDFNETQPDFASVVNSGISDDYSGGSVNLNVPTLRRANTSARNTGMADIQSAMDQVSTLRGQRTQEEGRVRDSLTGARSQISGLSSQLANMGLRDYQAQRGGLAQTIAQTRSGLSSFSSPILGEFMTQDRANLDNDIANLEGLKSSMRDRLGAEEQRISSFRNTLLGDVSTQSNRLRDMTIADAPGLTDAQAQLDLLRGRQRGFTSELNADLSAPSAELDNAASRLATLQAQRSAEQNRINDAIGQFRNEAVNAQGLASGSDIYNLNNLTSLANRTAQLRSQANSFRTPLSADFSGGLGLLEGVDNQVNNLRTQRQTALDALMGRATGLSADLGSVPLQNESAILDRRRSLDGVRGQLSQFMGNDLADERSRFDEVATALDGRLQEVAARRSDIESRARALQSQLANGNWNNESDLDPADAQIRALRSEQELFSATQALDELDALTQRLANERSRVQRDVAARNAAQRAEQNLGTGGFNGTGQINVNALSPEEIMMLLSGGRRNRNDNQVVGQQTGAFSSVI